MKVVQKVLSFNQKEELLLNIFNWDHEDKQTARWVPRILTLEHKQKRVSRTFLILWLTLGEAENFLADPHI